MGRLLGSPESFRVPSSLPVNGEALVEYEPNFSDVNLQLEAQVRILERRLADRKFQIEELQITNEMLQADLDSLRSQNRGPPGESSSDLTRRLRKLTDRERDLQIEREYSDFLLSEKRADFAFFEAESLAAESPDDEEQEIARLEREIRELEGELAKQAKVLRFSEQTEDELQREYRERSANFTVPPARAPSDDWEREKELMERERDDMRMAVGREIAAQREAQNRLEKLQTNLFSGSGIEEADIKKALAAHIEFGASLVINNLMAAIEAELACEAELKLEVAQARRAADLVKTWQEEVVERHKQQYELATRRPRLQALRETLDAIPRRT
jgi:hypothetical protein